MSIFESNEKISLEIYGKYADMLYRLALANLGDNHDAEDAVHDVFIKYLQTKPDFKDGNHEEGWFVRVTVNTCKDFLRKKRHRGYTPLEEVHHLKSEDEEQSSVIAHLQSIPEKYRNVIVLHYFEGYSVGEISEMLNISISGVKMRLSRGRDLIKEKIEKED